jgi:hypothetical protein
MRKLILLMGIAVAVVLYGCSALEEKRDGCKPPPQDLEAADLVGTWWAGVVSPPRRDDTIIIKEDGTYKQIVYLEAYSVNYESDWLPWYIEYFEDGIPYLHLEGLRLCAHAPDLRGCEQEGGGEKDWDAFNQGEWFDYCREKWLLQENEGILLVLSAVEGDGLELAGLGATPLDTWIYLLQKPEVPTSTLP